MDGKHPISHLGPKNLIFFLAGFFFWRESRSTNVGGRTILREHGKRNRNMRKHVFSFVFPQHVPETLWGKPIALLLLHMCVILLYSVFLDVHDVLCPVYLNTCVRVCQSFHGPLRECLQARRFRATLLLHLHLCAFLKKKSLKTTRLIASIRPRRPGVGFFRFFFCCYKTRISLLRLLPCEINTGTLLPHREIAEG